MRNSAAASALRLLTATLGLGLAIATTSSPVASVADDGEGWVPLFNGQNLEGWTVKVAKHPLGEDYADTFRVEDGIIKVAYDKYARFDEQFGHLYTVSPYARYVLRLEYLFTGRPMADAPAWAGLNSGVMIHSQSPLSMTIDQLWPVSMECQLLAEGASAGRQNGNVCTPGTNLERNGDLTTEHCIDSTARQYPLGEWVAVEVEVHGDDEVIHRINGVEVLRYQRPQLDPRDPDAQRLLAAGLPLRLGFGHIALQAEGQPVWFRSIRLRRLEQ